MKYPCYNFLCRNKTMCNIFIEELGKKERKNCKERKAFNRINRAGYKRVCPSLEIGDKFLEERKKK